MRANIPAAPMRLRSGLRRAPMKGILVGFLLGLMLWTIIALAILEL